MSMRISESRGLVLLALLALSGCDRFSQKVASKVSEKVHDKLDSIASAVSSGAPAPTGEPLVCRPAGAKAFESVCTLDRDQRNGRLVLTVHHPDGGFRRFEVTRNGQGVIAADGAQRAVVSLSGASEIEVALGGDRYRLPAMLKGQPSGRP